MNWKGVRGTFVIFAAVLVVACTIYFLQRSFSRSASVRDDFESQVLQQSGDGEQVLSVVETTLRSEESNEPAVAALETPSVSSFVSPEQVREGISVLRGDLIPRFVLVTEIGVALAMSDRTEAVLVATAGMSEEGADNVRESALQELMSDNVRSESFLENICANADFYASSAMELAEKVLEYDIETDRLKEVRLQQLAEDLSLSDFDKLLNYSINRAHSMSVTRADLRIFATRGLLDASGYVTDICGSKV